MARRAESFDDGVELTDGFFGEETVLTGNPSTHTVRAVTYSDFFVLPIAVFNEVLKANHGMRALVDAYAERKRGASLGNKKKPSMMRSATHASLAKATKALKA